MRSSTTPASTRNEPRRDAGRPCINAFGKHPGTVPLTALIKRPGRLIYLSSGLHRGGEGSLGDFDWTKRAWERARAYAESKLHVVALALVVAWRCPDFL